MESKKAIQSKSKSKSVLKSKMRRLKWIVEEFLEKDLSLENIQNDKNLYQKLRAGIINSLLLEEDQKDSDYDREEGWSSKKQRAMFSINIDRSEKIIRYYSLLLRLWIPFKKTLTDYKRWNSGRYKPYPSIRKVRPKGRDDSWVYKAFFSDLYMYFIDLDKPIENDSTDSAFSVGVGFDSNKVRFATSDIDVIKTFLSLLNDIPIDKICECEDENCSCWFVKTYSRKKFCSNRCASRNNQKDLRKNPERKAEYEKVKKDQKARYRKKVLG